MPLTRREDRAAGAAGAVIERDRADGYLRLKKTGDPFPKEPPVLCERRAPASASTRAR
jgi:hypothetical protein